MDSCAREQQLRPAPGARDQSNQRYWLPVGHHDVQPLWEVMQPGAGTHPTIKSFNYVYLSSHDCTNILQMDIPARYMFALTYMTDILYDKYWISKASSSFSHANNSALHPHYL